MDTMSGQLYDEQTISNVIDAYMAGEKMSSIARRLGIDLAGITWILDQHGKMPKRFRRAERLAGNREQMGHLYAHIKRQDEYIVAQDVYIKELQALLRKHKVKAPPRPNRLV